MPLLNSRITDGLAENRSMIQKVQVSAMVYFTRNKPPGYPHCPRVAVRFQFHKIYHQYLSHLYRITERTN